MLPLFLKRLCLVALLSSLSACAGGSKLLSSFDQDKPLPIIFVHGNGDNASIWKTVLWRFESNGYPSDRLFAYDFRLPLARADDTVAQPGRSGTAEQMQELGEEIARVKRVTGASKVVLVANSRGGYSTRNYVRNHPEGRSNVEALVLGGVPNHGVWSITPTQGSFGPASEFNGAAAFLTALNSPQGTNPAEGLEVTPGVRFATLRSDKIDKFAQAMGVWIGQPQLKTNVTSEGPALKGATNIVLAERDHREVSYHPEGFAATYQFITGKAPGRSSIVEQERVQLNGRILALHDKNGTAGENTNLGLAGAKVSVYQVQEGTGLRLDERGGVAGNQSAAKPAHQKTVGADGLWGPFAAQAKAYYEFVIEAEGFNINHVYRSPFPRSSQVVHFRPARVADADKDGAAVVTMNRPRGYFGVGRDEMSLDNRKPPPGIPPGVPGLSTSKIKLSELVNRAILAEFNGEKIATRPWPLAEQRIVFAEFHY